MGRGPGRVVARWAGWGAVVPCVVVVVLAVLAIASGNVPLGEVLAYAVVLAIVLVPGCAPDDYTHLTMPTILLE